MLVDQIVANMASLEASGSIHPAVKHDVPMALEGLGLGIW